MKNRLIIIWSVAVLAGGLFLSILDGVGLTFGSFIAYSLMLTVFLLVGFLLWRKVEPVEKPKWLLVAVLTAFSLRVLLGLGFLHGLPIFGYQDSEPQQEGYVFSDAFERDMDGLSRARSERPLSASFADRKASDQYGGLLFLSAAIYRYLSPDTHRPMLMVAMVAAISSYAVLFTWAFYSLVWGRAGSKLAAWIIVLYPEAAMLGASQMREPFLITAFAAALYGYGLMRDEHTKGGGLTIILAVTLLALPISPPFAIAILIFLGFAWVWEGKQISTSRVLTIILLVLIALVALMLLIRSWQGLEHIQGTAWRILIDWWRDAGGDWRINLLSEQSLWLDNVLDRLPGWADIPFLVAYGLLQPFLPASIAATGAPLWRVIAIWRSLGWYLILPLFIYAPFLAIRSKGWRSLETYLSFAIWATALVASYRALGFQWDNPRYRAVFLTAQAAIAAWVWTTSRMQKSRWIKRLYLLLAGSILLVLQWYLGRYYGTPRLSLGMTLAAVGVFLVLSMAVAWILDAQRRKVGNRNIDSH